MFLLQTVLIQRNIYLKAVYTNFTEKKLRFTSCSNAQLIDTCYVKDDGNR